MSWTTFSFIKYSSIKGVKYVQYREPREQPSNKAVNLEISTISPLRRPLKMKNNNMQLNNISGVDNIIT